MDGTMAEEIRMTRTIECARYHVASFCVRVHEQHGRRAAPISVIVRQTAADEVGDDDADENETSVVFVDARPQGTVRFEPIP